MVIGVWHVIRGIELQLLASGMGMHASSIHMFNKLRYW